MPESYTGDEGDEAIAAGIDVMDGGENWAGINGGWRAINKTRDYIAQFFAAAKAYVDAKVGTLGAVASENVVPIAKGGHGATTAAGARTNLNVPGWGDVSPAGSATAGGIARYSGAGRLQSVDPASGNDVATLNSINGRVAKTGDTMSGDLFLPGSSPANSGYTIGYINGDGRVSRGASSERFKKFISEVDPLSLGNLFKPFRRWQMRRGDGVWRYGNTAEQLAADPATEPFVIYERHIEEDGTAPHLERDENGNPIPLSIDFIGLYAAQIAQLDARIKLLEDRT